MYLHWNVFALKLIRWIILFNWNLFCIKSFYSKSYTVYNNIHRNIFHVDKPLNKYDFVNINYINIFQWVLLQFHQYGFLVYTYYVSNWILRFPSAFVSGMIYFKRIIWFRISEVIWYNKKKENVGVALVYSMSV